MLKRNFRRTESIVRYWAGRSLELCRKIDSDEPSAMAPEVEKRLALVARTRRIVIIGEKGCGKSSLIAGLLGIPCIAAHEMKAHFIRWRLGNDDGDSENSRFLGDYQLDRLELVDTGDCRENAVRQAIAPLLAESDLVIAVMGGDNPWCPSAWELLSGLPEGFRTLRIIALTHCDRRSPEDIRTIKAQIRELSMKRLGIELPLYQVTPGGTIQGTGLDVFAERVQDALDSPSLLRGDLHRLYTAAVNLLDEQASILRRRNQMLRTDSGFLSGIDSEIDVFQRQQAESIPRQVQGLGHIVQSLVPDLSNMLSWRFGFLVTPGKMLQLERLGEKVDGLYYNLVRRAIERRQEAQDRAFIFSCRENWVQIRPRMKQKLECDIGEFPEKQLEEELQTLRRELGHMMYKPLNKLGVKPFLINICHEQITWMTRIIYMTLFFIITAGIFGGLGHHTLGLASLSVCALVWLIGCTILWWEKARLKRRIEEFSAPLQMTVTEILRPALQQLLVSRVSAYRKLFTEPRLKVTRNTEQLAPLLAEHREIYRTIRSIGNYL